MKICVHVFITARIKRFSKDSIVKERKLKRKLHNLMSMCKIRKRVFVEGLFQNT